jgi:hypothetical protein
MLRAALVCVAVVLALPATAHAVGGHYRLVGGTKAEQQTVAAALEASSFHWDLVPAPITIKIIRGAESDAIPGQIVLDANLLDAGTFSWGVVQHEYAHQVDYLLLDVAERGQLLQLLGGRDWCDNPGVRHADLGCERFASTLAWSYWPSPNNCMKPDRHKTRDESAALPPRRFREVVGSLLATHVAG